MKNFKVLKRGRTRHQINEFPSPVNKQLPLWFWNSGSIGGKVSHGNPAPPIMKIYQMRHAILAKHIGERFTPTQLKVELLEKFPSVKPKSVNAFYEKGCSIKRDVKKKIIPFVDTLSQKARKDGAPQTFIREAASL
jgi:hypothetical protein